MCEPHSPWCYKLALNHGKFIKAHCSPPTDRNVITVLILFSRDAERTFSTAKFFLLRRRVAAERPFFPSWAMSGLIERQTSFFRRRDFFPGTTIRFSFFLRVAIRKSVDDGQVDRETSHRFAEPSERVNLRG